MKKSLIKKSITFFSVLLLICTQLVLAQEKDNLEISPNAIESIYFNIYLSLGTVNGYVIFYDKDGRPHATNGRVSLAKETTYYEQEPVIGGKYKTIKKTDEKQLKDIVFKASDFRVMKLKGGDKIYALPIVLSETDVKKEDVIILNWYNFESRKALKEL
jgi:hypothetical protein